MKKKSKKRSLAVAQESGVERWTVERLDKDAGMSRIEVVPMRAEHTTDELLDTLLDKGAVPGMDRLSLWDAGRIRNVPTPIAALAELLDLRRDELAALSENMVFWVVRFRGAVHIIHATSAARRIIKTLYREVALGQEVKNESK